MENIQPSILRELQKVELDILKKFDSVCRKYDIQYCLFWGTMLGAVRHSGFIPWDDDIDVGMTRVDYEKLRAVPPEEWNNEYLLADPKDESHWLRYPYPRIYKLNTVFETRYRYAHDRVKYNRDKIPMGIWLDIFVLDDVASPKAAYRTWPFIRALFKLYYWAKCRIKPVRGDSLKAITLNTMKFFIYYLLNIVPKPELKIAKKIEKLCLSQPGEYIVDYYADHINYLSPCKRDDFFPLVEVQFEDMQSWIPKNAHKLMTDWYGDYMKLPPEDQRVNHQPYILDLGDGRGKIIDMGKYV